MTVSKFLALACVTVAAVLALQCSKSSSTPTQPTTQGPPPLTATPSSVSVSANTSQDVTVSGGMPPYAISGAPSAIATAQLLNSDSAMAIVHIVGVTVASVSTSVVINDNTASTPKSVSIPVTVH